MSDFSNRASRLSVDIGGTFTDIFLMTPDGRHHTQKILSTPDDYSRAVAEGAEAIMLQAGVDPGSLREVLHGTTIVTNTCIEMTGAKVGLITTKGFRDVLEIGRGRMPRLYDLTWSKPPPLAPRHLRLEIDERISAQGEVIKPLDMAEVRNVVDNLISAEVQGIAICLFNSPSNPVHEEMIGEYISQRHPEVYLSISTRVMPLIKEYERTCETVVNAYVMPIVSGYLRRLKTRLLDLGITAPLFIMQSNGGMITADASAERPVEIVECGPAGGVVGAAFLANSLGYQNLITLDLGGTTCKASIVENGQFTRSTEYEVGAGIHMASRLRKGNGYVLRVPSIDIAEIGAGGGSLVGVDSGGLLTVGPRSAGADPGPACYNRGGENPTLTDCYLVLGYLNPVYLLGGDFDLNPERSYQTIGNVAKRVGMTASEAAYGAYLIANSNMSRAINAVSSERGRDPRKFVALVFGGAGALHGVAVAKALGMRKAIIAPHAGVFSAFGFACADIERYWVKGFNFPWDESVLTRLADLFGRLTQEAQKTSADWGYGQTRVEVQRFVDLRYRQQASELSIPLPEGDITTTMLTEVRRAFDHEHRLTFGHAFEEAPVEVASIRMVSRIALSRPELESQQIGRGRPFSTDRPTRRAYFGREVGFVEVPIVNEGDLGSEPVMGPALIDRYDTTIVIPPGCQVSAAAGGTLIIDIMEV